MNEKGQVHMAIPMVCGAAALLLAVSQAVDEQITIPSYVWELRSWLIVALIALVVYFVRQTFHDHERRLRKLEKETPLADEKLDTLLDQLRLAVARLEAVCPFCEAVRRQEKPRVSLKNGTMGSET